MNFLAEFGCELAITPLRPERLALLIGGMVEPDLSISNYVFTLDALAQRLEEPVAGLRGTDLLDVLLVVLHGEMGFAGNATDYYDPANSFLHRVMDRRLGLPITLSLLYSTIGQRLGIRLDGMGFPGHFMLQYADETGSYLLDPFHARTLPLEDAEGYLTSLFQQPVRLQRPLSQYQVTGQMWLLRILNNLRAVFLTNEEFARTIEVLNFMLLLEPGEPALWRERGLLRFQAQQFLAAESDLRHFFYRENQIQHYVEQRPIGTLQPFMPQPVEKPGLALPTETLELLAVLDHIRQHVARLN